MIFETLVVGPLGVNCFIAGCAETREVIVVDPGADPERIRALVDSLGVTVKYIVNTHGHFDHVGGNGKVREATGAKLLVSEADTPFLSRAAKSAATYGLSAENSPAPDAFLTDGMVLTVGKEAFTAIPTPGHTPGGFCLYNEKEATLITGDTLFADSVGRTDLPGGSHEILMRSITERLLTLPDETVVHPGHGPLTTIGRERRHNPYLGSL